MGVGIESVCVNFLSHVVVNGCGISSQPTSNLGSLIGPPAKRHSDGVSLGADNGPNLRAGLVNYSIYHSPYVLSREDKILH